MTEVTAYPDSGPVQDTDTLWLARGGVGYQVQGSRFVRTEASGAVTLANVLSLRTPGDEAARMFGGQPFMAAYNSAGSTRFGFIQFTDSEVRVGGDVARPVTTYVGGSPRWLVGANLARSYGPVVIGGSTARGRLTVLNDTAPTTAAGVNALLLGESSNNTGYQMAAGLWYNGAWRGAIDMTAAGIGADLSINPSGGNVLIGSVSGTEHRIHRASPVNTAILSIASSVTAKITAHLIAVDTEGFNTPVAAMWVGRSSLNGRSINTGGTINASGADYAEYMTKADGCGEIVPGAVCGVDANGKLVTSWAEAQQYRVKSTDPNLCGGDKWGTEDKIGARPIEPLLALPAYDGPSEPEAPQAFDEQAPVPIAVPVAPTFDHAAPDQPLRSGENDVQWASIVNAFVIADMRFQQARADFEDALAAHPARVAQIEAANAAAQADYEARAEAHATAVAAYEAALAAYGEAQADHAAAIGAAQDAHAAALTTYQAELSEWEARLEAERVKVDRIAYCGQVPVNFAGEFAAGDYLVAVQDGDGIGLESVTPAAMIADLVAGGGLYLRRVGRVLRALDDGRPLIDVQHG